MNVKYTVSEGVAKRRSVRAYLGKARQRDTVEALLTGAAQALSKGLSQSVATTPLSLQRAMCEALEDYRPDRVFEELHRY